MQPENKNLRYFNGKGRVWIYGWLKSQYCCVWNKFRKQDG